FVLLHLLGQLARRFAVERRPPSQQFVQDHAECVDVALDAGLPGGLFRSPIDGRGRLLEGVEWSQLWTPRSLGLRSIRRNEDASPPQVPETAAAPWRVVPRLGQFFDELHRWPDRLGSSVQPAGEPLPFDQLLREVAAAIKLAYLVQLGNAWVVQPRCGRGFL